MTLSITGARLELGGVLKQQPSRGEGAAVHINVSGQQANTLLHDGHAWWLARRITAALPR